MKCRAVFQQLDERNSGSVTLDQLYGLVPAEYRGNLVTMRDLRRMCVEVGVNPSAPLNLSAFTKIFTGVFQ